MNQIKNKAVIYVRVSTEEQATEGFSIQAQLDALRNYAHFHEMDIVNEYLDEGVSGKNISGRPQLLRLIKDSRNKQFDTVLIYKIDRIARKAKDSLQILDELEELGVKLVSLKENFDASTPVGKLMYQMMSGFAEMERSTIIERTTMGMNERAKQGKYNGGLCLGYDNVDKLLVINEEEALIIRKIFNLSEQQLGYKAIVRQVNLSGHKTKKGNSFSVFGVKVILDNPVYIGNIRYGQIRNWSTKRRKGTTSDYILTKGVHEPIITIEQWDRVQRLRKQRSYKPVRSHQPYILSGLVKCPVCGHGMVPGRAKGSAGVTYRYYNCGQFHNKGTTVCSVNGIRADILESAVFNQLSELVSNPAIIKRILNVANEQRKNAETPILEEERAIHTKLKHTESQIINIITALANGMNSKAVQSKLEQLEAEKEQYESSNEELKHRLSEADTTPIDFDALRILLSDFQHTLTQVGPEQQKALLRLVIKNIQISKVTPRQMLKINLHFDFTLESIQNNSELVQRLYPSFETEINRYMNSKTKYNITRRDLFGSLPILPLAMIRFPPNNLKSPINLLHQNNPHQLMRVRNPPKRQQLVSTLHYRRRHPIGAADYKRNAAPPIHA